MKRLVHQLAVLLRKRRIGASNCGNLFAVHDPAIGLPPGERSGHECASIPKHCLFNLNREPDPHKRK